MINFMTFRNQCAEDGVELTPQEAKETINCYEEFSLSIKEACENCSTFYNDICNKTTEQKLEDIERLKGENGCKMTLKEYNQLQKVIIKICKIEGYDNGNYNF